MNTTMYLEERIKIDRNKKYRYDLYNSAFNKKIVKHFGYCLNCGQEEIIKESKKHNRRYSNLNIHHIDNDKTNNSPDNLTVLCNKCHQGKAHILIKSNNEIIGQLLNTKINFPTIESEVLKSEKLRLLFNEN